MDIFGRLNAIWSNISATQKALLITAVLIAAAITAGVFHWTSRPDMRLLYGELSPEQAAKICDKISEKSIEYKLAAGGTSIYVPKRYVYQLRLDMAREGLADTDTGGYKLFDNEKIGVSPFVQNVNLKRALEEEIARSIQMLDGVLQARVHLVASKQKIFDAEDGSTSASVVLKLHIGYELSSVNIAAITNIVAGSVEGLDAKNVTVVDSQGNLLSGQGEQAFAAGGGTVHEYKQRVEQALSAKVEDMLAMALGTNRARVKISAVVDTTSKSYVTEIYDPATKVATKEEIKSNSETGASRVGSEGQPAGSGSVKKDETISTEYLVGKTVEQTVEMPGEIKSLSVAAFVDLSVIDANGNPTDAKVLELADVEQIIKNAIGLKDTDALKVVDVHFNKSADAAIEEPKDFGGYIALAKQFSLGLTGIIALLMLKMFSKASAKSSAAPQAVEALPAGGTAAQLNSSAPSAGLDTANETALLKRQIAASLKNNPAQVRQMFMDWIQQKDAI